VPPGENILAAALAAGVPLPYSCRAGRCATCKARLVSGEIEYPGGRLPPGIVAFEAAKGEVLLCQARPLSDLRVATHAPGGAGARPKAAVAAIASSPIVIGGTRATLEFVGAASFTVRPGQFVDVEAADDSRERVPVVAVGTGWIAVELHELAPETVMRICGPYDSLR
jgi:CDP-4-dehydro-6-deoxyglucose reductase, E3